MFSQPASGALGARLIYNLALQGPERFDICYIAVAYVRRSGIGRIYDSLQAFRKAGGKVKAIVGIDDQHTSVEGLETLLDCTDEAFVYDDNNPYRTFHPKLYAFARKDRAEVFTGSSNLTQGGLFSNYEAVGITALDLRDPSQKAEFDTILAVISQFSDTSSLCCRKLDRTLVNDLKSRKLIISEQFHNVRSASLLRAHNERLSPLFGTKPLGFAIPTLPSQWTQVRQQGFWKKLSANDVSPTSSPGQIIIPLNFMRYFPPMQGLHTTGVGAREEDVFFNLVFRDNGLQPTPVNDVRAIHYVPAPTHARHNEELRFTFRNKTVFRMLAQSDVLEFRRTNDPAFWFEVTKWSDGSPKAEVRTKSGAKYGAIS